MNLQTLLVDERAPSLELDGLCEHTAEVAPGFAFIGVAANDETLKEHCTAAARQGAVAMLCPSERAAALHDSALPVVGVADLDARRGELAARFYGDPSSALACVGVTGTNGKTSVAYHVADCAALAGLRLGYSGTLGWGALDALEMDAMTTANAVALQRRLATLRDRGFAGVAMEVSSHALDQKRADAVAFDVGVFTNLSRDHLDYHGTFEAYGEAKARLFEAFELDAAVINIDDEFGRSLSKRASGTVITYGRDAEWRWRRDVVDGGADVRWTTPVGEFEARVPMIADYAIANLTAALAALSALGHAPGEIVDRLDSVRAVPGRMEMFGEAGQPTVVVDYAHTPDALTKVLDALRAVCRGRLACVVGCGGDRDRGKRPQMAAAAATADRVWLTSDNPRSEAPEDILADMRAGLAGNQLANVVTCIERDAAIGEAIRASQAGDIVLVAGKGHEDYQEVAGQRLPFDDRVEVVKALEGL